ncbi:SPX domain-containing protein 4 [Striga hermonthica]|uniref:SPX domain-containing protein 4 n=1 Tax=Striga hermonthica TaxID=68872 RepID=A0A9N7NNJ3_STRHE|nr:SPX domain-containing protein 4 [Striga hermonthica]
MLYSSLFSGLSWLTSVEIWPCSTTTGMGRNSGHIWRKPYRNGGTSICRTSLASQEYSPDNPPPGGTLPELRDWFVGILNKELEKFNDFYVDKEEEFIIRFQALKERIELVKARVGTCGVFTSEAEFSREMMEKRKDFVAIHGEMVLLRNYSSLNFAGLFSSSFCRFVIPMCNFWSHLTTTASDPPPPPPMTHLCPCYRDWDTIHP